MPEKMTLDSPPGWLADEAWRRLGCLGKVACGGSCGSVPRRWGLILARDSICIAGGVCERRMELRLRLLERFLGGARFEPSGMSKFESGSPQSGNLGTGCFLGSFEYHALVEIGTSHWNCLVRLLHHL